ncbi:MAG: hypothetical protein OXF51_03375 [Alphaproteobacteria bacterium]|nr:hypothetical protein [Alphaproteobacteria bacterium]
MANRLWPPARDREDIRLTAPPVKDDFDLLVIDLKGCFLDEAGEKAFAVAVGRLRCIPDPFQRDAKVGKE